MIALHRTIYDHPSLTTIYVTTMDTSASSVSHVVFFKESTYATFSSFKCTCAIVPPLASPIEKNVNTTCPTHLYVFTARGTYRSRWKKAHNVIFTTLLWINRALRRSQITRYNRSNGQKKKRNHCRAGGTVTIFKPSWFLSSSFTFSVPVTDTKECH